MKPDKIVEAPPRGRGLHPFAFLIPHSRGLSEHGVFSCEECCIPAYVEEWDTNWRRIWAKSVSDGWSPEMLHSVVSMMAATLLSLKGHFCPSFTPHRQQIASSDEKFAWFNLTP